MYNFNLYKYTLKISIFSEDDNLEMVAKNDVIPNPEYEHEIKTYKKFSQAIYQISDIAIIDLDETNEMYNEINSDVKCMFVTSNFKTKYKQFSSVLVKPINYSQFAYELKKLVDLIAIEDKNLYMEDVLNITINSMPDMFWVKSLDGHHVLLNNKFAKVVNKPLDDIIGKDHYYMWGVDKDDPESGYDVCEQAEEAVIAKGTTLSFNENVKGENGYTHLISYKTPLFDKRNKVIGTIGIAHDATALRNLNIENQIIIDGFPEAIVIIDKFGNIKTANKNFCNLFGTDLKSIVDLTFNDWARSTFDSIESFENDKFNECVITGADLKLNYYEIKYQNILDAFEKVSGQVCTIRDATKEKNREKELEETSYFDELTGLHNRRYLKDYVSSFNTGTLLTLFYIDLDNFKNINDTYGHLSGDEALIILSIILKGIFSDDIIVRMGGDEFLVVSTLIDIELIKEKAQILLDTLLNEYQKIDKFKYLSASIGITQGEYLKNEFKSLLKESDSALYKAKENGKACYVINDKILVKKLKK